MTLFDGMAIRGIVRAVSSTRTTCDDGIRTSECEVDIVEHRISIALLHRRFNHYSIVAIGRTFSSPPVLGVATKEPCLLSP